MNQERLLELSAEENEMVLQGKFLDAINKFFVPDCKSIDFDETITNNLEEKIAKAKAIIAIIKKINSITLHHTAISGNVAFAEFTFDFDMKDGSRIYWHEVIRTVWKDDKIIEEQYFKS